LSDTVEKVGDELRKAPFLAGSHPSQTDRQLRDAAVKILPIHSARGLQFRTPNRVRLAG